MPKTPFAYPLDRRFFLAGLGATGAALLLPGCHKHKPMPDGGSPGPDLVNEDQLRLLREAIRSSPDHLSARAAEIIASKNPTAAVRFVRDRVAVLPPQHFYDGAVDGARWGAAATLRAGAGTMRERVELLAAMLTAMGAQTRLRSAPLPASVTAAVLSGMPALTFAPEASRVAAVKASFGAAANGFPMAPSDPDPSPTVSALLATIPANQAVATKPYDGLDPTVPIVEYIFGGTTRWAYALGDVDEVDTVPTAIGLELNPITSPAMSMRLLGLFGSLPGVATPSSLVELVSGTWTVEQVAGNRVTLSFPPPQPELTLGAPREGLPIRLATMALQKPTLIADDSVFARWEPPMATAPAVGFSGPAFSLSGAQFAAPSQQGQPAIGPYGQLLTLDDSSHAAALASVRSLKTTVLAGAFPDLELSVTALDGAGAPVFGLNPADFTVTDDTVSQSVTMLSNARILPRVLIAYDCSISINWPTPAAKSAFEDTLVNAVVGSSAMAPFTTGFSPLGGPPAAYSAPDAPTLKAELASCYGESDVWTTMVDVALDSGASAVVVVSDFRVSDDPAQIPRLKARLAASGLPVALVPVPDFDQPTVDAVMAVSPAVQTFDPMAMDFGAQISAFLSANAKALGEAGYRLRYRLPSTQQTTEVTRTAAVSVTSPATAAANYQVPAVAARVNVGVAGLYLEITIGNSTVRRWLSGPPLDVNGLSYGDPKVRPDASHFEATRDLLSGLITVAIEPGAPTIAANADDFVDGLLSLVPLMNLSGQPRSSTVTAGSEVRLYGAGLAAMVDPLPRSSGPVVAPQALRVVVMSQAVGASEVTSRVDVVPELNIAVAASLDAAAAFRAAMASTVSLSLREASAATVTSAGRLAGSSLQFVAAFDAPMTLTGFTADDLTQWQPLLNQYVNWHRLVPTTPAPGAMWVVDPNTGSTASVFLDGTGGGGDCGKAAADAAVQEALALLSFYAALKSISCSAPGTPSKYACLGATVGGVAAGAAALYAAGGLDYWSAADVWLFVVSLALSVAPGAGAAEAGGALALAGTVMTSVEAHQALADHC